MAGPEASRWAAPAAHGPVRATVTVPGSNSLTNRYLVTAAAADSPSVIRNPLVSRDSTLMIEAVRSLGAGVEEDEGGALRISPSPSNPRPAAIVRRSPSTAELAGTVMRFVPALAAATGRPVHFDGDETAYTRPMSTILDSLESLGATIDSSNGGLRFASTPRGACAAGT